MQAERLELSQNKFHTALNRARLPIPPRLHEITNEVVGETGLEPATSRSQSVHSSQLSYSPMWWWAGRDSNPRRQSHLVYSQIRLTASVPTHVYHLVLYQNFWSHLPGSNWRQSAYKAGALPTELRWPMLRKGDASTKLIQFTTRCQ